jgi:glycosyltransferase involved in cell wall biosynthesis
MTQPIDSDDATPHGGATPARSWQPSGLRRGVLDAALRAAGRFGLVLPPPAPRPRPAGVARARTATGKPHVVAVTHSLAREGSVKSLIEILAGLVARLRITLVAPLPGPLAADVAALGIGLAVVRPPEADARSLRGYDAALAAYASAIDALAPDLAIANTLATFHAIDCARQLGVPSLWIVRESAAPADFLGYLPRPVLARALACTRYPAQTVVLSRSTLRFAASDAVPATVVATALRPAGVEALRERWTRAAARQALGIAQDEVLALTVGTLCDIKGQRAQLDCLERVPENVRLVWVGAPGEPGGRALSRALARAPASVRRRILLAGTTPDIARYYAAADVYVSSSTQDTYPRVLLEALAFGLPIVATPVDGCPELLADAPLAWVEPSDPAALARALTAAARDPDARPAAAARAAARYATLPGYDAMIDVYLRLIDASLASA